MRRAPILVTGAARGLGAEICHTLALQGHDLIIHYRKRREEAKKVKERCVAAKAEISLIEGDFSKQRSLEKFIRRCQERFPQLKGIVHNVGEYLVAPSFQTTPDQWLSLFQVNFFAPVFITQALLPQLRAQKGSVVNIGVTGLSSGRGFCQVTAYAATKAALCFYTRSLAKELAKDEIKVNMVSPGAMENTIDKTEPNTSLKQVANVVALLFDPNFSQITGQNIEVASGFGL